MEEFKIKITKECTLIAEDMAELEAGLAKIRQTLSADEQMTAVSKVICNVVILRVISNKPITDLNE